MDEVFTPVSSAIDLDFGSLPDFNPLASDGSDFHMEEFSHFDEYNTSMFDEFVDYAAYNPEASTKSSNEDSVAAQQANDSQARGLPATDQPSSQEELDLLNIVGAYVNSQPPNVSQSQVPTLPTWDEEASSSTTIDPQLLDLGQLQLPALPEFNQGPSSAFSQPMPMFGAEALAWSAISAVSFPMLSTEAAKEPAIIEAPVDPRVAALNNQIVSIRRPEQITPFLAQYKQVTNVFPLSLARPLFAPHMPPSSIAGTVYSSTFTSDLLLPQRILPAKVKAALLASSKIMQPEDCAPSGNFTTDAVFDHNKVLSFFLAHHFVDSNPDRPMGVALKSVYVQSRFAAEAIVSYVAKGFLPSAEKRPDKTDIGTSASGYVYVIKEGKGVQRWTDGRKWSPSRKGGTNINIYREVKDLSEEEVEQVMTEAEIKSRKDPPTNEEERGKRQQQLKTAATRAVGLEHITVTLDNCEQTLFVTPEELALNPVGIDSVAHDLVGAATYGKKFLVHGLVKRTYKVEHSGVKYTLVNYYNIRDVLNSVIHPVELKM
ncbi:Global transcription regulator sge1 [Sporothrix curviconia]|uniref:Global transcription regulator sge1 n=1 Tax=Sporothrix curviconia TaxID=1260050 RepID=A0ABP0B2B2_9PEZI